MKHILSIALLVLICIGLVMVYSASSASALLSDENPTGMLVRQGATLLVHRNGRNNADVPEHVADNAQLLLQPEIVLKRTTVRARKGDNVMTVARRYGVSATSVAEWNDISINSPLKKGQALSLMLPQRKANSVAREAAKPAGKTRSAARPAAKPTASATKQRNKVAAR